MQGEMSSEPKTPNAEARTTDAGEPATSHHSTVSPAFAFLTTKEWKLLRFLLRKTAKWVIAGVVFMFIGIIVICFALLPRVHTCPPGATCPHSFDPHHDILRIVQTVMVYWLRLGCIIAGLGLIKVFSYQAWLVMERASNTTEVLELSIAATHGSASEGARLFWKRDNRALGVMAWCQFVIFLLLPLLVNLSISNPTTDMLTRGTFIYPETFTLPSYRAQSSIMGKIVPQVNAWLRGNNETHPIDRFHGTFVFRDSRINHAIDAQAGGSQLTGTVFCNSSDLSIVSLPSYPGYNITYQSQWVLYNSSALEALGSTFLGKSLKPVLSDDNSTVSLSFLWSSNTTGVIPNTTTTSDGRLHLALCTHTIETSPLKDEYLQHIQPSRFSAPNVTGTSICAGYDEQTCLKVHVVYALIAVWGGYGERFYSGGRLGWTSKYCQRAALTADTFDNPDAICAVSSRSWSATLAIIAEGIMEASPKDGVARQDLLVEAGRVSKRRWWLQATIPGSVIVLYVLSIWHISHTRKPDSLRKLSVMEIVQAAVVEQDVPKPVQRRKTVDPSSVGGLVANIATVSGLS